MVAVAPGIPMSSPAAGPQGLTHLSITAPITSLAFLGEHLLAGESTGVNVLPITTDATDAANKTDAGTHKKKKNVFGREKVHGIHIPTTADPDKVLFWGGRSLRIASIATLLSDATELDGREITAADWILSAALLNNGKIVAVGAHNELLIYNPATQTWCAPLGCGERTMLYSADLRICGSDVTVAAGTVFGEIVIWDGVTGAVRRRLRGHEGSVFGVKIDAGGRWVGSCSDDRTVRVWDLEVAEDAEAVERETTGFGGERVVASACAAIGWGHQARPWAVRFVPSKVEGRLQVVSVGEDLTVRFWEFETDQGGTAELRNTKTHTNHVGKNAWAVAFDYEKKLMATGGNDGRVVTLRYAQTADRDEVIRLQDVLKMIHGPDYSPPKGKKKKSDAWKLYAVLDENRLVATTAEGAVLLYDLRTKSWTLLGTWSGLRNWGQMDAWTDSSLVALGLSDGKLLVIDVDTRHSWTRPVYADKVGGVFACGRDGEKYYVLTQSINVKNDTLALHLFVLPPPDSADLPRYACTRPSSESGLVITSVHHDLSSQTLYLGTRNGAVGLCQLNSGLETWFPALYGTDAITSIRSTSTVLTTTSRTGTYALHSLPAMTPLHIARPTPTISSIEGSHTPSHIHGFRGLNFITHSLSTQLDVLSVECGGAHRSWSYHPQLLAWTQSSDLHLHRAPRAPDTTLLIPGYHGREIKTAAFSPATRILATGAEDTTIRFATLTPEGVLEPLGTPLKLHSTGVIALAWSRDGERLVSAGGVEELYVWRVSTAPFGVVLEGILPLPADGAGEVRFTALSVTNGGYMRGMLYIALGTSDSMLRELHYTPTPTNGIWGKTWEGVYTTNGIWVTTWEGVYNGTNCVTAIALLPEYEALVAAGNDGFICVWVGGRRRWRRRVHQSGIGAMSVKSGTGANDGRIRIVSGGDDGGVGVCVIDLDRLCKGADSEGADGGEEEVMVEGGLIPEAHGAAVTGVVTTRDGVVSVGGDMKIRVWEWALEGTEEKVPDEKEEEAEKAGEEKAEQAEQAEEEEGKGEGPLKLVWTGESGVADVGDMVAVGEGREGRVVVVGMGLEVWGVLGENRTGYCPEGWAKPTGIRGIRCPQLVSMINFPAHANTVMFV
ncbi:WD40-repeat-containing domain protein [Geopyxis carbonaria]|nr:WD40-repeat-containing domain protein [Geopyxis carbonaria]